MSTADGYVVVTTKIVDHGPPSQRWNLVILGDGYQATELANYHTHVEFFVDLLHNTAPFDRQWGAINIYRVDVVSTDSGADDPATCGDGSVGSGTSAATYFDSTLCFGGSTRRVLYGNAATSLSVARTQVPEVHVTLVIVNTPEHGGSGGAVSWFSIDNVRSGVHELAHSFFGLADEYGDTINTYVGPEPAAPNVTTDTNPATTKWRADMLPTTLATLPTPTMKNPDCTQEDTRASPVSVGTVGLFEGGGRAHCGLFRPEYTCLMRELQLNPRFCAICQRRISSMLVPFGGTMDWDIAGNSNTNPANHFLGTTDNQPLVIRTNGAERVRLLADGRLGIGTATPRAKLEVNGGALVGGLVIGADAPGINYLYEYESIGVANPNFNLRLQSQNDIFFHTGGNPPTEKIVITGGGNVGIGTATPRAKLDVTPGPGTLSMPGVAMVGQGNSPAVSMVYGINEGDGRGVMGLATQEGLNSFGVLGMAGQLAAPTAASTGGLGVVGASLNGTGVGGVSFSANFHGVEGSSANTTGASAGLHGRTASPNGVGVYGENGGGGQAGRFLGNVGVSGTLQVTGTKQFRIDHPLDPANKYLNHFSIESPDILNVYSGNVTTDGRGQATVKLPAYFEALNRDYRYQLTVIGGPAQAWIAREIEGNRFTVRTDRPKVKVCWQVSGVRQDPYVQAHPLPVEEDKPDTERGRYLHPELYVDQSATPESRQPIGFIPSMFASSEERLKGVAVTEFDLFQHQEHPGRHKRES